MTMRHQAVTLVFFKYIKLGYNVLLTTTRTVEMMMMELQMKKTHDTHSGTGLAMQEAQSGKHGICDFCEPFRIDFYISFQI